MESTKKAREFLTQLSNDNQGLFEFEKGLEKE